MEREIDFRENWLIFLGIWGGAELILRILGAKENTFRELRIFLRDLGRSMHYFQGSREHTPPPPPSGGFILLFLIHLYASFFCSALFSLKKGSKQ